MGFEMLERQLFKTRVLFVCTDNLCRSPVAKAVFEKKIAQAGLSGAIQVDSAGTHVYHVGQKPDSRSQHAAAFHGYNLMGQTARQVTHADFEYFDMILAMDWHNLRILHNISSDQHRHKIELVMRYAQNLDDAEVPDPYYEEQNAFNLVVDYLEDAASGVLDVVKRRTPQPVAA